MILRFIVIVSIVQCVHGLCAAPGESRLLQVESLIVANNETGLPFFGYEEGTEISYSCRNSSHLLLGSAKRKCVNGRWTHAIPACVIKIDSTLYTSVTDADKLIVTFTNAIEISGFIISAVSEDLQIVEPSNFHCNAENASLICISDEKNNVQSINLRFDKELSNNESAAALEFFNYIDDTCVLPDMPAFSHIEKSQETCKNSSNCTHFIYKCWNYFDLQPENHGNINCETEGKDIPLCVPKVVCAKLPALKFREQKYTTSTPWNGTHFLPDSVVTYNCEEKDHILRGDATRRCTRNGTWDGEDPVCEFNPRNGSLPLVPVSSAPDLFNLPMLITLSVLVIGTVLIVFVLIIVIHKRNQRIAQLQRLGSLRSRNFYFDVPIQTKPSYKHGMRVDDNIGLTTSDYNMDPNRDTAIFYTKEIVDNRYSRVNDRFSLPSNGFQYEIPGNLPAVLVTDELAIPQISL